MKYPSENGKTDAQNARRRWLTILAAAVAAGVLIYGLYWLFYARHFVSTDDAYVGGDVVSITSRDPATVVALHADNTQTVRRGQLLIEFDPSKAEAAFEAAKADLARAVRGTRTNFSKVDQFHAQVNAARVALDQAQADYRRRQTAGDSVSREELNHARDAVASAQASLKSAQSGLAQAQAAVQGTRVSTNPDVLAAIAQLRSAAITLSHMKLYAPVDGVVAQRTVQVGQQVAAGTPLMAVVPLDTVWIDANFKEGQLEDMRVGQPVTATADIYGGGMTYHGKVAGLGAGSGSAFALLPPQNASGNWIKIVQRVPVRIALDPKELRDHPLRVGLSMDVEVDVRDTAGSSIGAPNVKHEVRGYIGDYSDASISRLIKQILAQNGA
ncbi:MAG: HlyD family efflux transporter periplasmic adaptor subunit [Proteobacteria bacterium]|nr:HlyD family efflux transporter periplasmic adaptor subunit [Pseudomonadota bacterium]